MRQWRGFPAAVTRRSVACFRKGKTDEGTTRDDHRFWPLFVPIRVAGAGAGEAGRDPAAVAECRVKRARTLVTPAGTDWPEMPTATSLPSDCTSRLLAWSTSAGENGVVTVPGPADRHPANPAIQTGSDVAWSRRGPAGMVRTHEPTALPSWSSGTWVLLPRSKGSIASRNKHGACPRRGTRLDTVLFSH